MAYQAVPLLVGVMRDGGSDGARQAAARAISNLVCSDATAQVGGWAVVPFVGKLHCRWLAWPGLLVCAGTP